MEQPNWHTLPPQCSAGSPADADIVCEKSFTLGEFDMLSPTWYEPSKQTSLGDNGKTVYFDLYVYGTPSKDLQYKKLLTNAAYHGEREGSNLTPESYGTFCKIIAVWRRGCVACNTGYTNAGWQCCGSIDNNYLSFEMKQNNRYLPGLEQPNWHTLPQLA